MDLTIFFSVVIIVAGGVITLSTVVPKLKKIGVVGEGAKAIGQSLAASYGPSDDTPGKITASEFAEAIEAGAKAVKDSLQDI